MKRIEWFLKLLLGWLCYWPVMVCPNRWFNNNRLLMWMLSWAGFYADDTGFDDYERRLTSVHNEE